MDDDLKTSAEAARAIAEATGKAIDAVSGFGRFLRDVLGDSAIELGGLLHDRIRFYRQTRLLRLERRFNELKANESSTSENKPIPIKIALPLLEAASLEDDDELQDMFARLLANGTNPSSGIEITNALVSILRDFGPLEAQIMQELFDTLDPKGSGIGVNDLRAVYSGESGNPTSSFEIALWNLVRLGCIETDMTWGGGASILASLKMTALGYTLMLACTTSSKIHASGKSRTS